MSRTPWPAVPSTQTDQGELDSGRKIVNVHQVPVVFPLTCVIVRYSSNKRIENT
jgi:hypothetical protein